MFLEALSELSISELEMLKAEAERRLVALQRRNGKIRDDFERLAKNAGLSVEEAKLFFGRG